MPRVDGPIITSLLDNDLYKLTQQYAVFRLFPEANVQYRFIDRRGTTWPPGFVDEMREQVTALCELKFANAEIDFLREMCPYLGEHYLEWLRGFQFKRDEIWVHSEGDQLIELGIKGPWYRTILLEVPLMAIVSELYFRLQDGFPVSTWGDIEKSDIRKAIVLDRYGIRYSEFGTRRRYSAENQERVVRIHKDHGGHGFRGTSNVLLAMICNLDPIGTVAHEWTMFHGALFGFDRANTEAIRSWHKIYGWKLGIALTDTYTTKQFFREFDGSLARLVDGLRHDSGDPIAFADRAIEHYRSKHINPMSKTLLFSDGLDVETILRIHEHCNGLIQDSYGIGTNFSNDVGVNPLNIVIKMSHADPYGDGAWVPTVKLSDVEGKHTGDKEAVEHCIRCLGLAEGQEEQRERRDQ